MRTAESDSQRFRVAGVRAALIERTRAFTARWTLPGAAPTSSPWRVAIEAGERARVSGLFVATAMYREGRGADLGVEWWRGDLSEAIYEVVGADVLAVVDLADVLDGRRPHGGAD